MYTERKPFWWLCCGSGRPFANKTKTVVLDYLCSCCLIFTFSQLERYFVIQLFKPQRQHFKSKWKIAEKSDTFLLCYFFTADIVHIKGAHLIDKTTGNCLHLHCEKATIWTTDKPTVYCRFWSAQHGIHCCNNSRSHRKDKTNRRAQRRLKNYRGHTGLTTVGHTWLIIPTWRLTSMIHKPNSGLRSQQQGPPDW
jgi:hypothetical protein